MSPFIESPPQSPAQPTPTTPTPFTDPLADVFESAPFPNTTRSPLSPSTTAQPTTTPSANPAPTHPLDILSDAPRLRTQLRTAGYRDGVAAAKTRHVQAGFDEGFALGAEIGALAGCVLGVLGGLGAGVAGERLGEEGSGEEVVVGGAAITTASAIASASATVGVTAGAASGVVGERGRAGRVSRSEVQQLLDQARKELCVQRMYAAEYFDAETGEWKYEVGEQSEDDMSFQEVARKHPLVMLWERRLRDLAVRLRIPEQEMLSWMSD